MRAENLESYRAKGLCRKLVFTSNISSYVFWDVSGSLMEVLSNQAKRLLNY